MTIRDILARKGTDVVTISPDETILEAMRRLVQHGIGSVVVTEGDAIVGILTERDALQLCAQDPRSLASRQVREAMTPDPVVALPEDSIEFVMEIMTRNRIRHLPVMDGGSLGGLLSIGDVVNALRTSIEAENRHLRDYIGGVLR
jgi:CBS domain-containing protein